MKIIYWFFWLRHYNFFVARRQHTTALPFFSGVFHSRFSDRNSCFSMISILKQLPEFYKFPEKMGGFLSSVRHMTHFFSYLTFGHHHQPASASFVFQEIRFRCQSWIESNILQIADILIFLDKKKSLWIRNKGIRDGWTLLRRCLFSRPMFIFWTCCAVLVQKINRSPTSSLGGCCFINR